MLIECDPSIKAIIVKINSDENNVYIIEDLDDGHLVVKENMVSTLKAKLDDVSFNLLGNDDRLIDRHCVQVLKNTQEKVPDSDEDKD